METIKKAGLQTFKPMSNAARVTALAKLVAEKGEGTGMDVIRAVGIATGTKSGTSQFGEWTCLVGDFRVIDPDSGEVAKSSQLFLPEVALLPLVASIKAGGTPQFAVDIIAYLDPKSSVGFSYRLKEVIESTDDPVSQLLAKAQEAKPLALPAPAAGAAPAAPTAPTTPAAESTKPAKGRK